MGLKPAWKWTGGKTQLLEVLHETADPIITSKNITDYIEPFIGAGAFMWSMIEKNSFDNVYIGDMNGEMICLYKTILNAPDELSKALDKKASTYKDLADEDSKKDFYYEQRRRYNELIDACKDASYEGATAIELSSLFMFLNRTCFNGLYRVNKDNHFNVPFGKYKNPPISQTRQIKENSKALNGIANLTISFSSYKDVFDNIEIGSNSFVYLDPPYRPLPGSASFTSYAKGNFNDDDQRELASFCDKLDSLGAFFMLSNSDPHVSDPNDDFFDDLYSKYNIKRVRAGRSINSKGDGRGKITEILVTNF